MTTAFGFRNLADYDAGLREIVRVLRPGGECGILDFGEPRGMVGKLLSSLLQASAAGGWDGDFGVKGPYAYLTCLGGALPLRREMLERMRRGGISRGFVDAVHFRNCRAVSREEVSESVPILKCEYERVITRQSFEQLCRSSNVVTAQVTNHEDSAVHSDSRLQKLNVTCCLSNVDAESEPMAAFLENEN